VTEAYSVIVPVHNNSTSLVELHQRIGAVFEQAGAPFELILVDDLSTDGSWAQICALAADDPRVVGVRLAANVRQTRAIFAGIEVSTLGPFVILDADLEDPPEAILSLIAAYRAGHDLVVVRRLARHRAGLRRLGSFLVNVAMASGEVRVSDLGSSFLLADRPLEGPVREQLHRTGTHLVLPHVVAASRAPTWIDIAAGPKQGKPSGYDLSALTSMGVDAIGTWVAPGVVARGRRWVPLLALAALVPGRFARARLAALIGAASVTVGAEIVRRCGTHPADRLYEIAERQGGGVGANASADRK
jgi:hypothetical protein